MIINGAACPDQRWDWEEFLTEVLSKKPFYISPCVLYERNNTGSVNFVHKIGYFILNLQAVEGSSDSENRTKSRFLWFSQIFSDFLSFCRVQSDGRPTVRIEH